MSNLDKNSIINMENTASYQPRSNLNVVFSTADRDSAVFIFNVTKGNKPLLLSSENVIGHIALKHSDGSFVKDTLHFTEPDINGRFEYYIPNDILKREGTVTMQIFISEKGNSNVTVAERIVTFDIEKSIVSQISAETKLQYIVEYDELKAIIANRVTDIEDNMANAEDYVSQLKQAREKGLSDIEIAKADSEKALNDLADKRLEEISDKAREYSSKFDDDKQYMDDKHQEFKDSVLNSEVVTQGESKEWQKYKLINDDGSVNVISLENDLDKLNNMQSTGLYYTTNTPSLPSGVSTDGWLTVYVRNGKQPIKHIYQPYGQNKVVVRHYYSQWSDWTEITNTQTDTGWVPFQLINGAEANTAFKAETDKGFDCAYRIEKRGDVTEKSIRINASKLSHSQQIAQLPENFVKSVQFHYVRAPINQGYGLVGVFPNGAVYVYIESDKRGGWDSTSKDYYFYGEFNWKE